MCLVLVGVTEKREKDAIVHLDGYRERAASPPRFLRNLKLRGIPMPRLAVGDGARGFRSALAGVSPSVRHQLGWRHKVAVHLDKVANALSTTTNDRPNAIMYVPDRDAARNELRVFREEHGAKNPMAEAGLASQEDSLLRFLYNPVEHWVQFRTTNPIESGFGHVKARTKKTRGSRSRKVGLAMAFKLIQAAEQRCRRVNAPHLVAAVPAGVQS